MQRVVALLPFVLPPLLGAIIGYVTNALAIRMLFRPLTERRFLGVRVPLTPGIIPRQREQLAHSIANMVSTKLITPDLLEERLHDPRFVQTLEATVARFTADVLYGHQNGGHAEAEVPPAADPPPAAVAPLAAADEARSGIAEAAQGLFVSFFHSDAFAAMVHEVAVSVTRGALAQKTDAVIPDPARLAELVDGAVRALSHGSVAPAGEGAVRRWMAGHLENDTPLVEIVGEKSIERLAATVPGLYEPLLAALIAFLRQPATRKELSVHGRSLLKRILERLNLFQRFLVSATQYDRNLSANMPAVVDDVIASVERAGRGLDNRDRLIRAAQEQVRLLGSTGVRTLLERFGLQADRIITRLFALAVDMVGRDDVRERITHAVGGFVDRHRDRSLGEIVAEVFGAEPDELSDRLVDVADRWVAQEDDVDRLASRVSEFVLRYFGRGAQEPLARFLPLTAAQKARVDNYLTHRLVELIEHRVPEVIAGLDVYTMVVDKINGLDVESVEQLLLMVIARHLKWINLFGALLGSLIGGTQVVIGLLT